ncbi:YczE/YyaS/YitT family protein [Anaerobacillus sp. MEB173]|uniref:YczE/YyaS/YitT family protein n=1 Tax=Anaerobacillus sp. MEB173 TaxID=3383345 RepID=UPI003F92211C
MRRELLLRWSFFVFGLITLAFGITLTIKGKDLGIGPWDVFHYGLFVQFGLSIGTWSIITGFLLLTITSLFTKKLPKIGAFINMFLLGIFIDLFNFILPNPESIMIQVIVFSLGVIILSYGIGLYVAADFGAGPRDSIMLLIVEKTGWSIQAVRNGIEVTVLLLGWLLGGPVGVGTIIIAFFLGTLLQVSLPQSKELLHLLLQKNMPKQTNLVKVER